jgi:tetratricopeptide (TPR) repeat protein
LLLICLLVAAQSPVVRPQYDLAIYLAVAARYRSADHAAARREIREWRHAEIGAAVQALRKGEDRLRAVPVQPFDIDFRTVEAAVLMHAEVGLISLQAMSPVDAEAHLGASVTLFEWSRRAALRLRERAARTRRPQISVYEPAEPPAPALRVEPRIDGRDYYFALASATLAIGFPVTARPFAEQAVGTAPMDAEVRLLAGCVNATLAEELSLEHRESDARRSLEAAGKALRDALALDPGLQEARLRLGKLLLDEGRATEAEALLAEVDERGADDRQRYLARLFLGRVAERLGRPEEATRLYGRALDAWPDSQAARLALARLLEGSAGPAAPPLLVGGTLAASRRPDRAEDPWWFYPFGPLELARAALERVWNRTLDR